MYAAVPLCPGLVPRVAGTCKLLKTCRLQRYFRLVPRKTQKLFLRSKNQTIENRKFSGFVHLSWALFAPHCVQEPHIACRFGHNVSQVRVCRRTVVEKIERCSIGFSTGGNCQRTGVLSNFSCSSLGEGKLKLELKTLRAKARSQNRRTKKTSHRIVSRMSICAIYAIRPLSRSISWTLAC